MEEDKVMPGEPVDLNVPGEQGGAPSDDNMNPPAPAPKPMPEPTEEDMPPSAV